MDAEERIEGVGAPPIGIGGLRRSRSTRQWHRKALMGILGAGPKRAADLGLSERIAVVREGFLPSSWELYRLDGKDPRAYLTDQEYEVTYGVNGSARGVFEDKVLFTFLAERFGLPVVPVLAILGADSPRWLAPPEDPIDQRSVRDRLALGDLVVKPVGGRGGRDFHALELAGEAFALDGERLDWPALERFLRRLHYFLVSPRVQQARYAAEIFPHTANTLRILTVVPPNGADPAIVAAVNRIGTERSRPVDNWVRGGLSAPVDLNAGVLGVAAGAGQGGPRVYEFHPDTGATIAGAQVPRWDRVREVVLEAARQFALAPYAAWDVIAADSGDPTIIEANNFTSVDVFQVHGPLLDNPVLRDFYASHRVLRRG